MYNGIINVYKEPGFTSHDVVAKLRGICKQKKIGHTGTLDPAAEGVLPVCLGAATKVCDLLTDRTKTYVAVLRLGVVTDTQDMTGTILSTSEEIPDEASVRAAIMSFQGTYDQIPPMYSALKVDGKKLYELAREGKTVERKARRVEISEINIQKVELPLVTIEVTCSKGTYIRTLCEDIGAKLGCGGAMEHLLRSRVGEFDLNEAVRLDELSEAAKEGRIADYVLAPDRLFLQYPAYTVSEEAERLLLNGNRLAAEDFVEMTELSQTIRIYRPNGNFFAIYEYDADRGDFKALKIFKD